MLDTNRISLYYCRIDFVSDKKALGAGKKRNIAFMPGSSDQEIIEAKGFLKCDLLVYIAPGMPNTSSKKTELNLKLDRNRVQEEIDIRLLDYKY